MKVASMTEDGDDSCDCDRGGDDDDNSNEVSRACPVVARGFGEVVLLVHPGPHRGAAPPRATRTTPEASGGRTHVPGKRKPRRGMLRG